MHTPLGAAYASIRYGMSPLRYAEPTALGQISESLNGVFGSGVLALFLILAFLPGDMTRPPYETDDAACFTFRRFFISAALMLFTARICGRMWILGETTSAFEYLARAGDIALGVACGGFLLGIPFMALGFSLGVVYQGPVAVLQIFGIRLDSMTKQAELALETILRVFASASFLAILWSPPLAATLCAITGAAVGMFASVNTGGKPRPAEILGALAFAIFISVALLK